MVVTLIVGCEIAFWAVLAAGLSLRYLLRLPRAGAVVLACVPLVDVVLFVATALDLRHVGAADTKHGLAAVYIGFSVGYGHYMVRWADSHFAHRFAGGPRPAKPPKYGKSRAAHEWRMCARTALAAAIAAALLQGAIWFVGHPDRTAALRQWQLSMAWVTVINAVIAASYTLWPKREPVRP